MKPEDRLARYILLETNAGRSLRRKSAMFVRAALALVILSQTVLTAAAADNASASPDAWTLYSQQKYSASADAFDELIRSSKPNSRLYYYAALANRSSNRLARARQLCKYIVTNFPSTTEAAYAQKLYPESIPKVASASDGLPESMKGKSIQELMKTEDGRKAVEEALAKKDAAAASAAKVATSKISPVLAKSKGGKAGERVFSASDIAKDGANGIDQMYYPNCWFESSMSALARLPRGQKLMADMLRYGAKEGSYVVRFPGDGAEYAISEEKLEKSGIHDKALWATLIEYGQTLKFPDDEGGLLSDGLGCLTGQRAETISPANATEQELTTFVEGAVKAQNPIICGSQYTSGLPHLVVPNHAYTIIDFEPAAGMVKIRNPHGANSQRFVLPNDEHHQKFEQLDDGVFKMHTSLFRLYFSQVARAAI